MESLASRDAASLVQVAAGTACAVERDRQIDMSPFPFRRPFFGPEKLYPARQTVTKATS